MPARISSGKWMLAALLAAACSHDWDAYDPRLGIASDASLAEKSGGGGTPSTGGSQASGGTTTGGTGGSGGVTGGAGGAAGKGGGGTSSGGVAGTPIDASAGATGGATGGTTGGGGAAGSDGSSGATGGTGGALQQATYPAGVADCISLKTPNPDICKQHTYDVAMSVDLLNTSYAVADAGADASTGDPTGAFVRFNLDGVFAAKTVTQVTLTLTVTSTAGANSSSSGEVWAVNCFARPDLFSSVPAKVGAAPLAADLGTVALSQDVTWTLPVNSVTAAQPACFGVFPKDADNVDYYNNTGSKPPTLKVSYQ